MRKLIILFVFAAVSQLSLAATGQERKDVVRKETFVYAVKGTDTLRLDKYDMPGQTGLKPCVVFMFGGGFVGGNRDAEHYIDYFNFLVGEGFTVVSIDYRLGFRKFMDAGRVNGSTKAKEFLSMFEQTVFMAVEDLFSATNYVLDNADGWNIDRNVIITSGSSAGAISVLQGEYERCNRGELARVLPDGFRYAGVVAFAGAVYSNKGHLKWNGTPAPLQLFHGDADKNVPYGKIKFGKFGFFGSEYIARRYDKNGYPYYFYVEENASHRVASSPMSSQREEILSFLNDYVINGRQLTTNSVVVDGSMPVVKKKRFGLKTYVKSNFSE